MEGKILWSDQPVKIKVERGGGWKLLFLKILENEYVYKDDDLHRPKHNTDQVWNSDS